MKINQNEIKIRFSNVDKKRIFILKKTLASHVRNGIIKENTVKAYQKYILFLIQKTLYQKIF